MSLEPETSLEAGQNSTEFFLPLPNNGWVSVDLAQPSRLPEQDERIESVDSVLNNHELRESLPDRMLNSVLPSLPRAAALLLGSIAAYSTVFVAEKGIVQAQNPSFPDPKKPLEVKGSLPSQNVRIVSNYEMQFFKTAGSELVGVANLEGETMQRIVKEKEDPNTGEKRLQQIGTASYPLRITDAAISRDNPDTVLGVGLDMSSGKGKAILSSNEGQSWQLFDLNQVPLLGRGPLLKVEIVDPIQAFIAQGDRLAEDYPNFFLNFNLNSKTFTDLQVCAGCTDRSLPGNFLSLPDGIFSGINSADPHLGYKWKKFTSSAIISSEELRGAAVGSVQGDPKQYIDRQSFYNILVFNNFGQGRGTVFRDRYQKSGNNFIFFDGAQYQNLDSLYPSFSTSFFFSSVVPDAEADDIYAGVGIGWAAPPNWVSSSAAFVEILNRHIRLPTNGDWIGWENDRWSELHGLDLSVKGANKSVKAALAKYKFVCDPATQTCNRVFEQGKLLDFDITGGIDPQRQWRGLNLYTYDDTHKLHLPVMMKNRPN